jgi:hypothetical protein
MAREPYRSRMLAALTSGTREEQHRKLLEFVVYEAGSSHSDGVAAKHAELIVDNFNWTIGRPVPEALEPGARGSLSGIIGTRPTTGLDGERWETLAAARERHQPATLLESVEVEGFDGWVHDQTADVHFWQVGRYGGSGVQPQDGRPGPVYVMRRDAWSDGVFVCTEHRNGPCVHIAAVKALHAREGA